MAFKARFGFRRDRRLESQETTDREPQIHADFSSLRGHRRASAVRQQRALALEDPVDQWENSGGAMLYGIVWGPLVQDSGSKRQISGHQGYGINAAGLVNCETDWSRVELPYNGAFGTNHSGLLVNTANGILVWNSILSEWAQHRTQFRRRRQRVSLQLRR